MVPMAEILEAKLVLTDELIKESTRRQKSPEEATATETDDAGAQGARAH